MRQTPFIARRSIFACVTPPRWRAGRRDVDQPSCGASYRLGETRRAAGLVAGVHRTTGASTRRRDDHPLLDRIDGSLRRLPTQRLTKVESRVPAGPPQVDLMTLRHRSSSPIVVPVLCEERNPNSSSPITYGPASYEKAAPLAAGPPPRSGGFARLRPSIESLRRMHDHRPVVLFVPGKRRKCSAARVGRRKPTDRYRFAGPEDEGGQTYQLGKGISCGSAVTRLFP